MGIKEIAKNNKIFMKLYDKIIPYYCICFPKPAIKMLYRQTFQKTLNFDNPHDLNEKINCLKLFYRKDPLVIQCADKWAMREYVKQCGFEEILVDVYGVYDRVADIKWEELPNQFALKFNKAAGMNIICRDKEQLNKEQTLDTVKKWFYSECAERYCELHYRKAPSKVICEKYLGDGEAILPIDYKVHCIDGEPVTTMVCTDRSSSVKFMFVDNDYRQLEINTEVHGGGILPVCPPNFNRMIEIARVLSKPFPLVRIDFYDVKGRLYIGEMTFTPQGGYIDFISKEGLDWMGELIAWPPKRYLGKKASSFKQ